MAMLGTPWVERGFDFRGDFGQFPFEGVDVGGFWSTAFEARDGGPRQRVDDGFSGRHVGADLRRLVCSKVDMLLVFNS